MSDVHRVLQEVGSPPNVPTRSEFNHLLAKLAPEKLVEIKNQLKIVMKQKQTVKDNAAVNEALNYKQGISFDGMADSEPEIQCKTQVLEMELLKLKGQFCKNKTTTMNLIKKLNNERTMVKESIKELTSSRREELQLIDTVKRNNLDLIHKKHQLELNLIEMSERIEAVQGSLVDTQKSFQEKELKIISIENEKSEMVNQIEMLKQINSRCFDPVANQILSPTISCNPWWASTCSSSKWGLISLAILCISGAFYLYSFSSSNVFLEANCEVCDYERVTLRQ